jgi:phospholipid/cholesterol/gamma-HCH transport system permease protein
MVELIRLINTLGAAVIHLCTQLGSCLFFLVNTLTTLCTTRLKVKKVFIHMQHIGVESCAIIFLTSIASGFALALQTYIGLSRLGGQEFIGVVVALGMTRELGPVLTGLMVTGRAGSAMAAELGTMQITEQIDALRTLCINPMQYLVVPRVVASTLILPFLTMFSMLCGIIGGYLYSTYVLELNPAVYKTSIQQHAELSDIIGGLVKSAFFGLIVAWIGTYMGYTTHGGARGVGSSTTKSVVIGSILIVIANYFLSSLLFKVGA